MISYKIGIKNKAGKKRKKCMRSKIKCSHEEPPNEKYTYKTNYNKSTTNKRNKKLSPHSSRSPPGVLVHDCHVWLVGMELDDLRWFGLTIDKHLIRELQPRLLGAELGGLLTHYVVTYEPILSLLVAGTGRITLSGLLYFVRREGRGREGKGRGREGGREGGGRV